MNIILLSGGSGKRLWPLSNDVRSKQFIKMFKDKNDHYESMVQRIYRQIKSVDRDSTITIATAKSQVSAIQNQLPKDVRISVEPCRRDTFPAIVLASLYLTDVLGIDPCEPVVVSPVDPYVDTDYFKMFKKMEGKVKTDDSSLVLMGILPTYPSEKYGYILPQSVSDVAFVEAFKEKPDEKTAKEYINRGALWNAGVFAYRLSYVIEKAHELMDFTDYDDLFSKYEYQTSISFDYAVVENEKKISVIKYNGEWKDVGTWNTMAEVLSDSVIGHGIMDEYCENTHVVNELDMPILAMGLRNVIISASAEGVLVADKDRSSHMKNYLDDEERPVMFAEKSWGSYRVLDASKNSLTVKVTLNPGHQMNYHSHERRDEVWTVTAGEGKTIVDGMEQDVHPGDVITIEAGCKHTIVAKTQLQVIEVQLGEDISFGDKKVYELDW